MVSGLQKTPGQASAAGALLEIHHPHGGLQYMAHVFDLDSGGIAWVDSGWTDPLAAGHVCHFLAGVVTHNRDGWCIQSEEDGLINLRPSSRESRTEGERTVARDSLKQQFNLATLSR